MENNNDFLAKLENLERLADDLRGEWAALTEEERKYAKEFDHDALHYCHDTNYPYGCETWLEFYLDPFFEYRGGCKNSLISAIAEKSESSWSKALLDGSVSFDRLRHLAALASTISYLESVLRCINREK